MKRNASYKDVKMTAKNVNYSAELTQKTVDLYQEGVALEQISEAIGKSVRSIRSKLVREGVYVAQPKAKAKKSDEPTKKEIMLKLDEVVPFPTDGLMGATKDCLLAILKHYSD